jgi:hypothetical protein
MALGWRPLLLSFFPSVCLLLKTVSPQHSLTVIWRGQDHHFSWNVLCRYCILSKCVGELSCHTQQHDKI